MRLSLVPALTLLLAGPLCAQTVTAARERAPGAKDAKSTVQLLVGGGPHAGSHTLTTDIKCAMVEVKNPTPAHHTFEVDFGAWEAEKRHWDAKALTGMTVRVPNADAAGPAKDFFVSAHFGPADGDVYSVKPAVQHGTGSVSLKRAGSNVTATFDVRTQDGVALKGTVQCTDILEY
jgi:hypothetical protein